MGLVQKKRHLYSSLFFELAAAIWAVLVFRYVEDRDLAAKLASGGFLLMGLGVMRWSWGFKQPLKSLVFWGAHIFTLGFTLPMIIYRFWLPSNHSDSGIQVFGVPLSEFHRTSEMAYVALILITIFELWKTNFTLRKVEKG